MRKLNFITAVAIVLCGAQSASAVDLNTTAAIEIVEGIVIAQTTGMNFGQVADHDGALVLSTNPATAMTDASLISFDPAAKTPGIFSVTSIIGASLNASFTDIADVAGLALSAFTVSLDGGTSNEANLLAITQIAGTDTWNVGATMTVTAATAVVGVATPGYTMTIVLN